MAWQDDAACRGTPLWWWFPLNGVVPEAAQRACSRCPVRVRCAEYGMQQTHGVWGGTFRSRSAAAMPVPAKPPVPEALQASRSRTYSSEGTATTTTAKPGRATTMTAKTAAPKTTTKAAAAPAPAVPDTAESKQADTAARSKSAVSKDGSHTCPSCKTEKPVTRFPTERNAEGTYERSFTECRECRDARRAARKAERKAAKATAA
jgi:hypothetical protein